MHVNLTRIDVICVGAPGADYARLIADYEQRLGRYVGFRVRELKGSSLKAGAQQALAEEARRIGDAIDSIADSRTTLVLLDPEGKPRNTHDFASMILEMERVVLIVGGAAGVDESIRTRVDHRLSLGPLTLPHQMARLVLTEQLYRSFRIARGEPYHL